MWIISHCVCVWGGSTLYTFQTRRGSWSSAYVLWYLNTRTEGVQIQHHVHTAARSVQAIVHFNNNIFNGYSIKGVNTAPGLQTLNIHFHTFPYSIIHSLVNEILVYNSFTNEWILSMNGNVWKWMFRVWSPGLWKVRSNTDVIQKYKYIHL